MNSMKRKKYMTLKDKFSRSVGAQNASGEEAPERMKRWSQSENNTQLWMWLVMEVKANAAKNSMKRKKDTTLKDELPSSVGA